MNRLESAQYNPSNAGPGLGAEGIFSVSGITYDGIGNILTLNRQGVTPCGGPGGTDLIVNAIDQLSYSYANGSRLSEVIDNATHPELKNLGVKNGGGTYQYDAAGRMTHDNHRGLVIEYNHLDLPRRITLQNGEKIEITYDATGRKWLQKKDCDDSRIYAGSVVLVADKCDYYLESVNTSDGRLVYDPIASQVYPEFYHKDHLGNVRLVFTDRNKDGKVELLGPTSEITQQNDYYPFGMRQEGDSLVFHQELGSNRYRYNGKEFSEELGLYDYGARWYDPAIARWNAVDPLASNMASWSPYNYVFNNPLKFTDPTGMAPFTDYYNQNGKHVKHIDDGSDKRVMVMTTSEDADAVDTAISDGQTGPVASNAALKQMDAAYKATAKDGDERGFAVAADGSTSSMVSGNGDEVDVVPARKEVFEIGKGVAYDVHTHPEGNDPDNVGSPMPSDADQSGAATTDSQNSVVLGFTRTKTTTTKAITSGNEPKTVTITTTTKTIGFYNNGGSTGTMDYNKYRRVSRRINKNK